jgi:hypothetical protein
MRALAHTKGAGAGGAGGGIEEGEGVEREICLWESTMRVLMSFSVRCCGVSLSLSLSLSLSVARSLALVCVCARALSLPLGVR